MYCINCFGSHDILAKRDLSAQALFSDGQTWSKCLIQDRGKLVKTMSSNLISKWLNS